MDREYSTIPIRTTLDEFQRIPRNPSYKYEYFDGQGQIVPSPKQLRLRLTLDCESTQSTDCRLLMPNDWEEIRTVLRSAFCRLSPLYSLSDTEARNNAIERQVSATRAGEYGDLVGEACVVALDRGIVCGALLVTLWEGFPNITWIAVREDQWRRGHGGRMLAASCAQLRGNWNLVTSSVYVDHAAALVWHWRMGFVIDSVPCHL
jgi:ribosomal protein S18 acetylase RimI-like enzyme